MITVAIECPARFFTRRCGSRDLDRNGRHSHSRILSNGGDAWAFVNQGASTLDN